MAIQIGAFLVIWAAVEVALYMYFKKKEKERERIREEYKKSLGDWDGLNHE